EASWGGQLFKFLLCSSFACATRTPCSLVQVELSSRSGALRASLYVTFRVFTTSLTLAAFADAASRSTVLDRCAVAAAAEAAVVLGRVPVRVEPEPEAAEGGGPEGITVCRLGDGT